MTVDIFPEVLEPGRPLVQTLPTFRPTRPSADRPAAGPRASTRWLAGVPTTRLALDDPRGWYQRALATDAATTEVRVLSLPVKHFSAGERAETRAFSRHRLDATDGSVRPFGLPADRYSWAAPTWSVVVKADQHVVAHAGILYRVIQVGDLRVPVGGIGGVMSLPEWRGRGYARAVLARATAFVAAQLWAPFALVICPREHAVFYDHLGWQVAPGPIGCEQQGARVTLADEVAVFLPCQGQAEWPSGPIELAGAPW